jgi:hypothetical protein
MRTNSSAGALAVPPKYRNVTSCERKRMDGA